MQTKKVLICGAGIAGPTFAYWLKRSAFTPTLLERAPTLRTSGYVIDFWGLGYDIAEKMGFLPDILREGYHVQELRIIDERGNRIAGFGTKVFEDLTGGRFVSLKRSDLSRVIFTKAVDGCEVIFDDSINRIIEDETSLRITFESGEERRFDLLIGADGLHSTVRTLAFGPQEKYEKHLGYTVAAFEVSGYRPRDENVYVIYERPGRQLGRFALRDDRTLFLFVLARDLERSRTLILLTTRKPSFAAGSQMTNGSFRRFSQRSTVAPSCTSTASVRSGWVTGGEGGWPSLGMQLFASPCSPVRGRRSR